MFWARCKVGVLIAGNKQFTDMRENKFCNYIKVDYILLEIMTALPSADYSIHSFKHLLQDDYFLV